MQNSTESFLEMLINKLRLSLQPSEINIVDDSARHAGHAGSSAGGASHFKLQIVSAHFEGLSPIARHRLVYRVLEQEMKQQIHALNIDAKTPAEAAR